MSRVPNWMRLTPAEVVLVIAILALISALAIPSLLAKRGSSNEASCRASLRTLTRVNENYRTRFHRYAATLRHLEGESDDGIDSVLASGSKSGYDFAYTGGEDEWICQGSPTVPGTTGDRYFFCDQSGVIRFSTAGPATSADPEFEEPRSYRDLPFHLIAVTAMIVIIVDIIIMVRGERRKSRGRAARDRAHVSGD